VRQEFLLVEYGIVLPDVVDGTGELVSEYRESFALAVFLQEAVVELFPFLVLSQEPHGRLGESPFEVHVADLLASTATHFAGKGSGSGGKKIGNVHLKWAFSEAAVGFLRKNEDGKKLYDRLVQRHGKGKALTVLAHKLARTVYHIWKHATVFDQEQFLTH
jgi:hypothetical protein